MWNYDINYDINPERGYKEMAFANLAQINEQPDI